MSARLAGPRADRARGCSPTLVFGPLANLVLWSFAEAWFCPDKLPSQWGFRFWEYVFRPTGRAMEALGCRSGSRC